MVAELGREHREITTEQISRDARMLRLLMGSGPSETVIETHDAGRAVSKSGGMIKRGECRLVVDVQPFAAALARQVGRAPNELSANSSPSMVGIDRRVEQERVFAAVGRQVDKTNQPCGVKCAHDTETVREDTRELARYVIAPCAREQIVQCRVIEWRVDAIIDAHHINIR
jgi:hypothetical protein